LQCFIVIIIIIIIIIIIVIIIFLSKLGHSVRSWFENNKSAPLCRKEGSMGYYKNIIFTESSKNDKCGV